MRTYCIVNRKGGVGKTTTAVELAYNLAVKHEQRVLLVDADSQANATSLLVRKEAPWGLDAILRGDTCNMEDVIDHSIYTNLDIIPATEGLGDYELECTIGARRPTFDRLRDLLEELAAADIYDRVVIDCPPYYSVSCISALSASNSIIIPATVDAYAAEGLDGLVRQIDNIRTACPSIGVAGVLVTQYHRCDAAEDAVAHLREEAPVPVFDSVIRRSDKALEATWAGAAVGDWSRMSAPARDYAGWVSELLAREGAAAHD